MSVLHGIKAKIFGNDEADTAQARSRPAHKVVMYSTRFCPFCMRARALLLERQVGFKEIAVDGKPELRAEMTEKSGRYTVPQIWIGDEHIGGCDELMRLDRTGALDKMLFDNPGESGESGESNE